MIRLIVVLIVAVPGTILFAAKIAWAVLRKAPNAKQVCEEVPRDWSRLMLRAAGVKVVLENPEVIRPGVPQVLVANHSSWFDVLALAAFVPGPYAFVAKKELERVPLFGPSVKACGHIFIDRSDRERALQSMARVRQRLEDEGPTVIMFPEGTRSVTGSLQPFKKGAFILAIQTGADVVPAAIFGSRNIMKKGSFLVRPGTVRVRLGEPIPVGSYDLEDRDELIERGRAALSELLASSSE